MSCELVRATTSDGLDLDGALEVPAAGTADAEPVDVFLLVHGTGSNFYAPGVLETFGRQALAAGAAVLRINTRGHDGIATIPGRPRSLRGGAAYEVIADCRHDLRAWLEFLRNRGFSRVALAGHSMGAVKAIYALAHDPHPAVRCVVAISPPRFCHAILSSHPLGTSFRDALRRAEDLVAAGRADELIAVEQPLPLILTAGGFLAKYGPHDNYDLLRYLPRIDVPVLMLIGTQSVATSPAFDGLPAAIEELARTRKNLTLAVVDGADTAWRSCLETPFERTSAWLRTLR